MLREGDNNIRKKIELNRIKKEKTFEEGFEEFIIYCKSRNLRETTIKHYRDIAHIICKFLKPSTPLYTITKKTIEQFIVHLKMNTRQNEFTINSTIISTRAIMYFFMKLGYVKEFKIPKLKVDKPIIETYTNYELELLLKKPDIKTCSFLEYRTWVIINFLLATGCRARTLCNMKIKDLDFENDLITYEWTKNRRQQIVPMSRSLKKILIEYLSFREGKPEEYLFVNAYGGCLKVNLLSHNIITYNAKRGVMKRGVHRFRHTFAKKWILNGGDIFRLQKMLGHKNIEMVRNYVDMFTDDLSKGFDEVNPLEQLNHTNKKGTFINMRRK